MIKQSRLLVVDSDKAIGASMTRHFRGHDFLVEAVDTGEKAIESAWKLRPDIVVVDVKLSDMTSFELIGRLHAMADKADIPILLVGTRKEIESSSVAGDISKYHVDEIDFPSLARKIRKMLATYRERRMIEELLVKESMPVAYEETEELTAAEQAILRRGGANLKDSDFGAEDPLLRGKSEYLSLLEASLTTAQTAKLLGVNESRVRQRLTSRPPSLFGIKRGAEWLIPSFQFEGGKIIPHLERVIAKLDANLHPVSFWRWFTSPDVDLAAKDSPEGGFSPREWLLRGLAVADVEESAEDLQLS